jgi:hypothetical protein
MLLIPNEFRVEFPQSEDIMGLWPATTHENGLRCLSPVFSTGASPILTASEGSAFVCLQ